MNKYKRDEKLIDSLTQCIIITLEGWRLTTNNASKNYRLSKFTAFHLLALYLFDHKWKKDDFIFTKLATNL